MRIDDNFDNRIAANADLARKAKSPKTDKSAKKTGRQETTAARRTKSSDDIAGAAPKHQDSYQPQSTEGQGAVGGRPSDAGADSIRAEKVARARQLIAAGAYNSPDIVDKIIDRLIEAMKEE